MPRNRLGEGPDPNQSTTQDVELLLSTKRTNPDKIIEQHLVGYSFYSGTPTPDCGTLQGGSCESYAYANGAADMPTVLGFEGVGRGDGNNPQRTVRTVIGSQGTALASGDVNVGMLVSLRARGPKRSGTGNVGESRSLDLQEPLTGTLRRTLYGIGLHRFRKGDAKNVIEVADRSEREVFAVDDKGLILTSPNGTRWRVTVSDDGSVSTTQA